MEDVHRKNARKMVSRAECSKRVPCPTWRQIYEFVLLEHTLETSLYACRGWCLLLAFDLSGETIYVYTLHRT